MIGIRKWKYFHLLYVVFVYVLCCLLLGGKQIQSAWVNAKSVAWSMLKLKFYERESKIALDMEEYIHINWRRFISPWILWRRHGKIRIRSASSVGLSTYHRAEDIMIVCPTIISFLHPPDSKKKIKNPHIYIYPNRLIWSNRSSISIRRAEPSNNMRCNLITFIHKPDEMIRFETKLIRATEIHFPCRQIFIIDMPNAHLCTEHARRLQCTAMANDPTNITNEPLFCHNCLCFHPETRTKWK